MVLLSQDIKFISLKQSIFYSYHSCMGSKQWGVVSNKTDETIYYTIHSSNLLPFS